MRRDEFLFVAKNVGKKMMEYKLILALAAVTLGVCPFLESAQAGQYARPVYTRQLRSGKMAVIYNAYQVDENCRELKAPSVKVTALPLHGKAIVTLMPHQPSYPADNARFRCNKSPVPMTVVTYRSAPGFVGTDTVKVHTEYRAAADPSEPSSEDNVITLEIK